MSIFSRAHYFGIGCTAALVALSVSPASAIVFAGPQNLQIAGNTAQTIRLTWNGISYPSTYTSSAPYNVYRSTDGVNFSQIATGLLNPHFTDYNLVVGVKYYYYVKTYFAGTITQPSAIVSAIAQPTYGVSSGSLRGWVDNTYTAYSTIEPINYSGPRALIPIKYFIISSGSYGLPAHVIFDVSCTQDVATAIQVRHTDGTSFWPSYVGLPTNYAVDQVDLGAIRPGDVIQLYFDAEYAISVPMTSTKYEIWW